MEESPLACMYRQQTTDGQGAQETLEGQQAVPYVTTNRYSNLTQIYLAPPQLYCSFCLRGLKDASIYFKRPSRSRTSRQTVSVGAPVCSIFPMCCACRRFGRAATSVSTAVPSTKPRAFLTLVAMLGGGSCVQSVCRVAECETVTRAPHTSKPVAAPTLAITTSDLKPSGSCQDSALASHD